MTLDPSSTAAGIARRVAAREISAAEVTRAHLDRITRVEPAVDAFLHLTPERAMEKAHGNLDGRRLFEGLLETVAA
jgi:aspartyl-tRNA(Asn)/glutamyl-tRNA(Gln) amidotransferase subunit A